MPFDSITIKLKSYIDAVKTGTVSANRACECALYLLAEGFDLIEEDELADCLFALGELKTTEDEETK